ncbi:MAG: ABC transporter permease [Candidatus Nanopelagicus sp.]
MLKYIVKRTIVGVFVLAIVSAIVFGVFYILPSDPARLACGKSCTPELMDRIRHTLELDQPLPVQYGRYVKGIFTGRTYLAGTEAELNCSAPCLGYSYQNDLPVTTLLKDRLPATLSIAFGASILWLLVGLSSGIVSALRRGTMLDKFSQGVALGAASLQIYFVGLILQFIFVDKLAILPIPGYTSPFESLSLWAQQMALPWITLAFLLSAIYSRLTRAGMIEVMSEDYVRTARAKGLSARQINSKHVLRGAITPIVTVFGLDLGALLGGAVITEYVFNIPGLGKLSTDAVANLDIPVVTGTVLFSAFFVVTANILVDLIYSALDPKVRLS